MINDNIILLDQNGNHPKFTSNWDYIKALAHKGIFLYPLVKGTKTPLKGSHGYKDATNDIAKLKTMFKPDDHGNVNYNVACSPEKSNMLVLDVDVHNNDSGIKWMQANANKLPKTVVERSKNKGIHLFFTAISFKNNEIPNRLLIDGIVEVKTDSTIIYPSDGYEQTNDNSLLQSPISATNDFLNAKIREAIKRKKADSHNLNKTKNNNKITSKWDAILALFQNGISDGERNDKLSRLAENLYTYHFNDAGVRTFVTLVNNAYCEPPLPQKELDMILKSKQHKQHYTLNINGELTKIKSDEMGMATNKNGTPKANFAKNITKICATDLADKYKYNQFAEDIFVKHGKSFERWSDKDLYWLRQYIETNYDFSPNNEKTTYQGVFNFARTKGYHPVKDMIETEKWDGKQRVNNLLIDYLGAEDTNYNKMVARKLLAGAIARIYHPGIKFELMPILTGKQGMGKSTLINKISGGFFLDNLSQLSASNKDDILKLQDAWLVEVSELEPLKHSSIGGVKAFISSQNLKYRRPYGGANSDYWVHNVYVGTTNEDEFLPDATGNRRFLPVTCGVNKPKLDVFNIDKHTLHQIYAEAKTLLDNGEKLYLMPEEERLANSKRATAETYDPIKEAILEYINMPVPNDWSSLSSYQREQYYGRYQDKGITSITKNNETIELTSKELTNIKSVATKELLSIPLNKDINRGIQGNNRALSRRVSIIFSGLHDWKASNYVKLYGRRSRGYKKLN